ncbi:peptide chain release factor 3 [Thermopolyspora sp. NPDC052614]|uniref:peptide chain release factor 3 n=1 Tax=Thermopolyspora sp. NPDC052614 TaxID=3155682 RepID=UPI003416CEFE
MTAAGDVLGEARRRRTFAVISHPDAGKSTMTEALALHASAITEAGAVHGKAGRRGVTSDWMELERSRGISITSAALRFDYRGHVFNLVDTPGHADFSEDTYRVLAAVDCAVMLLDAAKGMEPQTLKLFQVCRHRRIPVITFVNKWDRPGREPLELLDQIEEHTGLRPTPITWPIGVAGHFRGVADRLAGKVVLYERAPGGATKALETELTPERAEAELGADWAQASEEIGLLEAIGADHDQKLFEAHETTPVLFGAALPNFGIARLLDVLVDLAPSPAPRAEVSGSARPLEAPFSGLVFKVQANMDPAHRDRIAFVRVCSGRFERGMVLTHGATGRPFATKYAHSVFGQERATIDDAYPGDVVGLVNATALRPGDTLYTGPAAEFPPIPSFAPEHFAVARSRDSGRAKQFRRGIDQLDAEGVIQVLRSDVRGDAAPVLAAVGPMQFEVVQHRLAAEFGTVISLDRLDYTLARRTDAASAETLARQRGCEVFVRGRDQALLAVFTDQWRMRTIAREHPDLTLEPLIADTHADG